MNPAGTLNKAHRQSPPSPIRTTRVNNLVRGVHAERRWRRAVPRQWNRGLFPQPVPTASPHSEQQREPHVINVHRKRCKRNDKNVKTMQIATPHVQPHRENADGGKKKKKDAPRRGHALSSVLSPIKQPCEVIAPTLWRRVTPTQRCCGLPALQASSESILTAQSASHKIPIEATGNMRQRVNSNVRRTSRHERSNTHAHICICMRIQPEQVTPDPHRNAKEFTEPHRARNNKKQKGGPQQHHKTKPKKPCLRGPSTLWLQEGSRRQECGPSWQPSPTRSFRAAQSVSTARLAVRVGCAQKGYKKT